MDAPIVMMNRLKDWLIKKKTIVAIAIAICIIILLCLFYNPLIFIIIFSISIFLITFVFPILYYYQLMKQQVLPEEYYFKFVEKNHHHLEENLLIKMFEIRINNQRNFLFSYLAVLVAFTFATLSNKDYFKSVIIYGPLNQYYWFSSFGIIGILVLCYATFGFDRFTLKELEILIKAKERLKQLQSESDL
jgi:hypothetical protein